MKNENNPWLVQIFGNPLSTLMYPDSWEISVVRTNNTYGRKSCGWFDENKLLISRNLAPYSVPLPRGIGQRLIDLAHEYAAELNAAEETK